MRRPLLVVTLASVLTLSLGIGTAAATHVHGKELPNGRCVLLAPTGGEKDVQLPGTEDEYGPTRRHPLHVKVHLGVPGTQARPGSIFVAIGDNGEFTPEATQRCPGGFLNAP